MQISAMWNHQIDLNLIYLILNDTQGKIDLTIACLSTFETWKLQSNNIKKYEKNKKEFIEKRCCNDDINLLSIFASEKRVHRGTAIEMAVNHTVNNGMPFVKKNK
ncbi:hypothetical protein RFI_34749 [Reticulomyxa filosa]|uniref:Uncharacterized protein n=1 Tax=Reticulomyxa filosa TaxID=46433 RepID=X6LM12_RETFI|nr:hypothetical protein RFI_34749 [Reticulomyxa filosa]|eukprot:ETO02669.1 hypothetical protein RFI_34749 [Reticulomyxa filosa]